MPKILVADDNTNIQKMVSLALEERGIDVVSVGNGEAAVRRIPDVEPDLVLADIFMPVRNGYEVCEFVKKDERFAHVPVILLVGAFDPLDEKEARRVGADGVLKKPFVPPDPLIAMVTSALEKNPRVAAELAKTKEAKLPPEPEPLPNIDLSARPEPKPLPEFPEPTPEEEALLYGMGKGQRSPYAGEAHSEPPAPVANPKAQSDESDDPDAQTSSSDWRRSAMDLEIPAELAGKPAIPSIDDLDPISFPSEKDYPPRRVSAPEPVEQAQPAVREETPKVSSDFSLRQVEDLDPAHSDGEKAASEFKSDAQELPSPNATTAGGHWLDAVSSAEAAHAPGGWMEALSSGSQDAVAPVSENESVEQASAVQPEPVSAPEESSTETSFAPPATEHDEQHYEHGEDQSFFADESEHPEPAAPIVEEQHSPASFIAVSGAAGADIELDADDSEPPMAFKDPGLVEPPAVHVTPEPLLVDEEASRSARYGAASEEMTPLHSFMAPATEPAAAPENLPVTAGEFSVQRHSEQEAQSDEGHERIPTMPPPNREALSHIPFLTPPPSFLEEMNAPVVERDAAPADPETVDNVVQKVLEKLQPQIQELLSQGLLKPLVENLLQNELPKKR